ncbi:MAG: neutral zinc metallopeptidase [Bryobacterales bacterium]|nr:neutral zinc metallopeptidase [Bryobacterales bacterium]
MLLTLAVKLILCLFAADDLKLSRSTGLFDRLWKEYFRARGQTYQPPNLTPFTGKRDSPCGKIQAGNAYYCEKNNTVYYDSDFLSALRLRVASDTGTSGDAAPVVAIAHELGHAVYAQLNRQTRPVRGMQQLQGYGEEKMADCLAGFLTSAAAEKGLLETNVLMETESTMALIWEMNRRKGHPNWRVRFNSFLHGYRNGLEACSDATFENLRYPGK